MKMLFDLSSIYHIDWLFKLQNLSDTEKASPEGIKAAMSCLENIVETIVIADELYLPLRLLPEGVANATVPLLEDKVLQALPLDWKAVPELLAPFAKPIEAAAEIKQLSLDPKTVPTGQVPEKAINQLHTADLMTTLYHDEIAMADLKDLGLEHIIKDKETQTDMQFLIKSVYYDRLAALNGLIYAPHPDRVSFLLACRSTITQSNKTLSEVVIDKIAKYAEHPSSRDLIESVGVPPIFAHILRHSQSIEEIIRRACEIRNSIHAQQFREKMRELTVLMSQGKGGIELHSYLISLDKMLRKLQKKLGLAPTDQASLSVWLLGIPVSLPKAFYKQYFFGRKRHFMWLKEIARDYWELTDIDQDLRRLFGDSVINQMSLTYKPTLG